MNSVLMSRQLEYFVATYQHLNFNKAAKSIPITYQGLKKAIGGLEKDSGVVLFMQHENGQLEATREADLVYDMALKWIEDATRLEHTLAGKAHPQEVTVKLCAAIGTVSYLGYGVTSAFAEQRPGYHIEITEVFDTEADDLLIGGKYPLGLTTAPFAPSLVTEVLANDGCIAWVGEDNPLSRKDSLRIEDLEGQRVMIPNKLVKANRFFTEALRAKGVTPSLIVTCPDPVASYLYAREGGIGISVETTPTHIDPADRVKRLTVENGYPYSFGVSWRRAHKLTEAEQIVVKFLKERMA